MRQSIQITIEDILKNNYLIADYMLIPELRKKLENATISDLRKLGTHLSNKENIKQLGSLIKSGKYKEYYESKQKDLKFDLLIKTGLELTGTGPIIIFHKAINSLIKIHKTDEAINEFVNYIYNQHVGARLEEYALKFKK